MGLPPRDLPDGQPRHGHLGHGAGVSASRPLLPVGGDADPVSLCVGENAEAGARDVLRGLNDGAAELFRLGERRVNVLDADEEQHFVLGALAWTDRTYVPPSAPVSMNV